MTIKVKITGKTEFYRRSEYYTPDQELIVELDVDSIDDVDQSMISDNVFELDVGWELGHDKDCFDEQEFFFEQVDEDEDEEE
jgi:hypothetical protein